MEKDSQKQKEVFAKNLQYWCDKKGITQTNIVENFNLPASTVSDWFNGKKFPRIDKIQMLADYLKILKSDLVEEKEHLEKDEEVRVALREPIIRQIARGAKNLTPKDQEKMLNMLKVAFEEAFNEDSEDK
ncbi:MAG: helix-turn-helix transcriptional regulator [Clostridia bacterium]|nr:helix-turn-helix transcriptional regulator [Clostridia bacterium]